MQVFGLTGHVVRNAVRASRVLSAPGEETGNRRGRPEKRCLEKREFAARFRRSGIPGANQCEESGHCQTGLM